MLLEILEKFNITKRDLVTFGCSLSVVLVMLLVIPLDIIYRNSINNFQNNLSQEKSSPEKVFVIDKAHTNSAASQFHKSSDADVFTVASPSTITLTHYKNIQELDNTSKIELIGHVVSEDNGNRTLKVTIPQNLATKITTAKIVNNFIATNDSDHKIPVTTNNVTLVKNSSDYEINIDITKLNIDKMFTELNYLLEVVTYNHLKNQESYLIPDNAIVTEDKKTFVLKYDNHSGEFVKTRVAISRTKDKKIEVTRGLTSGDKIFIINNDTETAHNV